MERVEVQNTESKKVYTEDEKREHRYKKIERYKKAYEEAINEIVKGSDIKITDAVFDNKDTAILYSFHYMKDKDAVYDSNGKKIIFGDNIHLLDMVTKGRDYFFRDLEKKFNKRGDNQNYCGVFKDINPNGDNINRWNIFVSWRSRDRQHKNNSTNNNNVNKRDATAVIVEKPKQQRENKPRVQREPSTTVLTTPPKSTGPKVGSYAFMAAKKE